MANSNSKLTLSIEPDTLLEKLKTMEVPDDIKSLTGILKGKYPAGTTYDDMRYKYFKDRYGL